MHVDFATRRKKFEMVEKVFRCTESIFAKLNVKQTTGTGSEPNNISDESFEKQNCGKQCATVVSLIAFPLWLYLCNCAVIEALPQRLGHNIESENCSAFLELNLNYEQTTNFCFDCIIRTSVVPAGAL